MTEPFRCLFCGALLVWNGPVDSIHADLECYKCGRPYWRRDMPVIVLYPEPMTEKQVFAWRPPHQLRRWGRG